MYESAKIQLDVPLSVSLLTDYVSSLRLHFVVGVAYSLLCEDETARS